MGYGCVSCEECWHMPLLMGLPPPRTAQFDEERAYIEEVFTPLVLKCKELGRCIRIGTNHGSLSARILSYYGDTPRWVEIPSLCDVISEN